MTEVARSLLRRQLAEALGRTDGFDDGMARFLAKVEEVYREREAERALHAQQAQSQKLEAIGRLASGIAHEINTPTQYIGDNVRFLRDSFAELEQLFATVDRVVRRCDETHLAELGRLWRELDLAFLRQELPLAIAQSLEGVERVTKIVLSMKELAHPDRGEKEGVDLNRVVTSATTVCRNEWKYVAELVLDLAPELPSIPAYSGDLGQVVLNLVVNAAHAVGERLRRDHAGNPAGAPDNGRGKITVRTLAFDEHVELHVGDDGCGIAPEHRERVFEQFFTTKPVGQGTGQGLALVRRIVVERHGGEIAFESAAGKGTTFVLRFPRSCALSRSELDDARVV